MSQSFISFLNDFQGGVCHAELSHELHELFKAVQATNKSGSITLTIKVKPAAKGSTVDKVMVDAGIKATLPKHERGSDFFWLTADAEPSRKHPKQQDLPLREVVVEAQSLRQV